MAYRRGKKEIVTDFILAGSKITADSDYSHEIERYLLLGRKSMTNLDSILKKQKHHLMTNVWEVQGILKSLLQYHNQKASILWCSAFFMVQVSNPYMTTGKTIV